jgi:ketosteroid isomerase-like protein
MMLQRNIHYYILTVIFPLIFLSCNEKKQTSQQSSTHEIIATDIAFSDMSRQVGMKKAFLQYIDDDEGVLLRPGHLPIVGADAIDFLSRLSDSDYTFSWTPLKAEISKSGDLGFTYGIYELKVQDSVYKGTYVSIWKKQNDGSWKFILDTGNEGIGNY